MSDLIDREALLRQIDIDSEGEPGYYGDTWKFIDTIKRMPSALCTNLAEVGTDCSEFPNNSDAISRQAAIDDIWTVSPLARLDRKWIDRWLRQLPPIQPEIIRCKDCKHHWTHKCMDSMPIERCDLGQTFYDAEVDFCSLAERRE